MKIAPVITVHIALEVKELGWNFIKTAIKLSIKMHNAGK